MCLMQTVRIGRGRPTHHLFQASASSHEMLGHPYLFLLSLFFLPVYTPYYMYVKKLIIQVRNRSRDALPRQRSARSLLLVLPVL